MHSFEILDLSESAYLFRYLFVLLILLLLLVPLLFQFKILN